MPRFRPRPRTAITAGLLALAVAIVLVVVLVADDDRPDFRIGNEGESSSDGEGLMGGHRTTRQRVFDPENTTRKPALVEHVGPGSAVLGFRTVILDRDAKPVRIRQRTLTDIGFPEALDEDAVRWRGYVALQGDPPGLNFRSGIGPWRPAGRDGVLVRPGQQVRLRTRYDLQPAGRACRTTVLLDGPRWEAKADGGTWHTLRARDDTKDGDDTQHRDVEIRTGQLGPLAFTSARPCKLGNSTVSTLTKDGMRDQKDLDYGGL